MIYKLNHVIHSKLNESFLELFDWIMFNNNEFSGLELYISFVYIFQNKHQKPFENSIN